MNFNFSNPERIIESLEIPEGARVADFGSGSGYFTLLLAKSVGQEGIVTAVDVLPSALEVIRSRASDRGFHNINYIRGNLEVDGGSSLENESQDVILLANILFQSQKKEDIIREAKRTLKSGGKLILIEWIPSAIFGPNEEGWKISKEKGVTLAKEQGFSFVKDIEVSVNHWGLIFKK